MPRIESNVNENNFIVCDLKIFIETDDFYKFF